MAKATKHVVPPVEPEYTLTLELSQREAERLFQLVGESTTDAVNSIYRAFRDAGVTRPNGGKY